MVRRLLEVDLSEVVMRKNRLLTAHDKAVLKEMVELLEPFEESTDILEGDRFVTISFEILLCWPNETSIIR